MSSKRRRSETSWDMKQDKMPLPESLNSESNDPRARMPSWEGNRNDDISRDKHRSFQYTARLPYRDRSRSRGREWESRSPFYDDRHKSNEYGRNNSRNHSKGDNFNRSDHHYSGSRYSRFPHHKDDRNHYDDDDDDDGRGKSNRISKMQCKFFALGKCYRDNCKFSHDASALDSQDYERRSHDNIRAHKNRMTWHHDHDQQTHAEDLNASDLSEKKKSWVGPTWDDVESGGFDENKKTTWDSHDFVDKKKSTWDDVSNPNLDNKNRSWNGPTWDEVDAKLGNIIDEKSKSSVKMDNNKSRKWDDPEGLNEKGNMVNDFHLNNRNVLSEEPNQQLLTSGEGQVENGKTPKDKQEQEHINTEKVEKGNIGNDEKSTQHRREIDPNRSRSPFYDDRQKSSEYGNHVRNNSRSDNLRKESWSHREDYSRSRSHNRNSRNHYDDDDDDRCRQSNRVTKIQCKFFASGNCNRDDCKFSHDVSDARNYDNTRAHKKMTWHDELNASDLSEKNKSWNGPTWDEVESGGFHEDKKKSTWDSHDDNKKSTTWDDMSNPNLNLDNKNRSWDDVESGGFHENKKKSTWESHDDKKKSTTWDDMSNPNLNLDNKNRSWGDVESGGFHENKKKSTWESQNCDDKKKSTTWDDVSNPNLNLDDKNMSWDDVESGGFHENKKKSTWESQNCDDKKKSTTQDYVSNPNLNLDNKNRSWDDVESGGFHENKKKSTWESQNCDDKKKSTTQDYVSNPNLNLDNKNRSWDDLESGGFHENKKKSTWESQNSDDKKKSTTRDDMSNPNLDKKNKSWDDVESENKKTTWESQNSNDKKKSSHDDVSNPNLDNKNRSWDEVDASNAKSGNIIEEKSKSLVKMDNNKTRKWDDPKGLNEKSYEKNDNFLPQQHNVVNDSHLNNSNLLSKEKILTSGKVQVPIPQVYTTEKNLTNAIDYLKSLPTSTQNQDTKQPKEGNIGNDEKSMRQFRAALVEFVKEILKPKWKEGRMTREVYKTVVKKVIDKITSTIQEVQIPKTQAKIEIYLTHSKQKIMKLVEAYVEKLVKA